MNGLTLNNISFGYSDKLLFNGFSLKVPERSVSALVGPSGCGKSTILRLLLGLLKPQSGSVTINGEHLTKNSLLRVRQTIGYVVQDGGLFPHLTAQENCLLLLDHLSVAKSEQDKRLASLVELTQLEPELLDHYPSELSGGQKQRIALIRALVNDPDILLLDEPLGALDSIVRSGLQDDLKQIFASLNKTVLIVTHDLSEAEWFSEDIVLMKNGEIKQRSSADEMRTNPASTFVEQFMNAQRSLSVPGEGR